MSGAAVVPFAGAAPVDDRTGRIYGPDHAVNPARWAMLQGLMARHLKRPVDANPYPPGSPAARCWLHGWHGARRSPRPRAKGVKQAAGDPSVSRETRSNRGPDWPDGDLAMLAFARREPDPLSDLEIGAIVGRSAESVRAKRARLRKAERC